MKWLARALVVIPTLFAAPVLAAEGVVLRAEDECRWKPGLFPDLFPANLTSFATTWFPQIEGLYDAIPFLSPKEERWLEDEREVLARSARAANSREYALWAAKLHIGAVLGLARRLTENHDRAAQVRDLLWFAYVLMDLDIPLYLARLEAEGVIHRDAIPSQWTTMSKIGATLQQSILRGRTEWAQHVLMCTLPSILDVSMEPPPWRTNPALRAR